MSDRTDKDFVLECRDHCKLFPGVVANDCVNLEIRKGEIHCLLGENGAGKSTLAKCLYGALRPDSGEIIYSGNQVSFSSPKDAISLGIGMIHQHFHLVPVMTVLENIVVGTKMPGFILKLDHAREKVQQLCDNYAVELPLDALVSDLSVGQQQWVEILKTVYVGVRFMILDEPTAVLTPQEIKKLFNILSKMKSEGISIILITHKLKEVMEISDRVSVLRKGTITTTVNTSETTKEDLARMMVGRDIVFSVKKDTMECGSSVLCIKDLSTSAQNFQTALSGIDLDIRKNEIVGLAGVSGNGQRELFDVIVGVTKPKNGTLELDGENLTGCTPFVMKEKGIASIPEDRIKDGLLMGMSISENLILGNHRKSQYLTTGFLSRPKIEAFAKTKIAEFEVAVASPRQTGKSLSGGNLQKVILAREFSQNPKFVIAHQPTRGLDVGAIEYVHKCILDLRRSGSGILLISEELEEIFALSDRIGVIYKGKIMGIKAVSDMTIEKIGLMMAGLKQE